MVRCPSESALVDLLKQVDGAVSHGAKVLMGGKRIDRPGSFMQPTILTDIKPDNPAFQDEFFGPVAMFFRVKDEDAAIALANDSDFGLGGSVFTKDIARGKRVASRVETGMMFINNISWSDAELPFGGIKDSGYGRELGDMGIQQFVNKKLVRYVAAEAPCEARSIVETSKRRATATRRIPRGGLAPADRQPLIPRRLQIDERVFA